METAIKPPTALPVSATLATCSDEFHEAFLERAARADGTQSSTVALGAFLTMRLMDQFATERSDRDLTALHYQIWSTREFLGTTQPHTEEIEQLEEIVSAAERTSYSGRRDELATQLLTYAEWLEGELCLTESSDVLATALRLTGNSLEPIRVKGHLQLGRVLRHLGQYAASQRAYAAAGELAAEIGDTHSELLSQIGCSVVLQKTGNLPESERMLREVLRAALTAGDRDAEARACHDLAGTLHHMNRGSEGAPLAFRAYQLYEQPVQRIRALSDTGQILKERGFLGPARAAFLAVIDGEPPPEIRLRTVVELVDLAALMDDRVSFERWRREALDQYERLPPDERVDFQLKVGSGLARFGRMADAEDHLRRAITMAEEHALPEWLFRAEAMLKDVLANRIERPINAPPATEPASFPELRATIEGLEQLGVS